MGAVAGVNLLEEELQADPSSAPSIEVSKLPVL